jgi:uncharacterized protein YprB with RNaseH-like and TPR domain
MDGRRRELEDMPHSDPFVHVGLRWRERIADQQEYSVIRDGNLFGASLTDSFLWKSDYERAELLKRSLIVEDDGATLEEALPGVEVDTPEGQCYEIVGRESWTSPFSRTTDLRGTLLSDLRLIPGIGEVTARRLHGRGYRTVEDLLNHPRFRNDARRFLAELERSDACVLLDWIGRRYPQSHPLMLETSGIFSEEEFVFLDIETLGLFARPIILFGVGVVAGGRLEVHQYLLRDVSEEPAALAATLAHLSRERVALVTFNGKTFDLPYLRERAAYDGLSLPRQLPHFDLLHFSRRRWKGQVPDCRLVTLERHIFHEKREGDVPSQMVPEFYDAYQHSGNCGPLVPIVEHNRQDVAMLARILVRLREEGHAGS